MLRLARRELAPDAGGSLLGVAARRGHRRELSGERVEPLAQLTPF